MSGLSVALQIVGSVAGAYFGGALGAYFGGLAGGLVGSAIDPDRAEGPKLGDLSVRASTYGKTIPLVYGRQNRIGGNVIWTSGLQEHEQKSGNWYSGEQISFNYTASFAIAIGAGVMRNIDAIYANGKLLWTRQATLDNLGPLLLHQANRLALCGFSGFAGSAYCRNMIDNSDFLSTYLPEAQMPDFTPWMLTGVVQPQASGGGGLAYGNRNATLFQGGGFSEMEWFPGTLEQPTSVIMGSSKPAYRGTAYLVFRDMQLGGFGNQIPTIEVVCSGLRQETVDQILADICERAGAGVDEVVPRGALSEMTVRGYAIGSARTAFSAIVPLMKVFPFDACDQDGQVRFMPRRQSPVCTIPLEDMGARRPDEKREPVFPIERVPNFELPSEASITYPDPANAYQQGTQIALRADGNSESKLNETVAVTMTADEARALAERMLWEGWLSREQIKPMRLSPKYDLLQPGELFAAEVPGGYTAFRVLDKQRGDDGIIEINALREDRVAYDGDIPGADPYTFDQSPVVYGNVTAALINAPMLTSADDDTGFHVAVDSDGTSWSEATVYRSVDLGESWQVAAFSQRRNSLGTVVGTLGPGPTAIWDRASSLTVDLLNPDAPPESVDESAVLGNALQNLVWVGATDGSDGELVQYATATQVSGTEGRYVLTNLLRGRRGTEHYVGLHASDDQVAFIPNDGLGTIDYGQTDWNLERLYSPAFLGQDPNDALAMLFTATGERLKPRTGVHARGTRDGSNNLTLTWVRRNRQFPPTLGNGAVPIGEDAESYEADVIVGGIVKRMIAATAASVSYSAAQQTADGITPGNPVTFRVYQISATYGRGQRAEFIV